MTGYLGVKDTGLSVSQSVKSLSFLMDSTNREVRLVRIYLDTLINLDEL